MRFSSSFCFCFFFNFFIENNNRRTRQRPSPSSWLLVVTRGYDVLLPYFFYFASRRVVPREHTHPHHTYLLYVILLYAQTLGGGKEVRSKNAGTKKKIRLRRVYVCIGVRGFGFYHQTFYQYLKRAQVRTRWKYACTTFQINTCLKPKGDARRLLYFHLQYLHGKTIGICRFYIILHRYHATKTTGKYEKLSNTQIKQKTLDHVGFFVIYIFDIYSFSFEHRIRTLINILIISKTLCKYI